ncbi:protein spaetzle [Lucilia sericata]|uniref:protein spaetzle n=1 Tax=Lucilia sericata TaxID=13632 RepID=UPI0018A7FCA0|nr:protein spaetzle [Lucilia sericata]
MAQFLTLLPVLLLIGVFNPDKIETLSVEEISSGESELFSTETPESDYYKFKMPVTENPEEENTEFEEGMTEHPLKRKKRFEGSKLSIDESDCLEFDTVGNGKIFCNKLRNYPDILHLERIINEEFTLLESYFNKFYDDYDYNDDYDEDYDLHHDEEFLCPSREKIIYPEAAINNDGVWQPIVNIPRHKQGIRIEECLEAGSTCGESTGIPIPNHYTAICRQSFGEQVLVAISEHEDIILDRFRIPSCCKCLIKLQAD